MNRPRFRLMLADMGVKPTWKGVKYMMDIMELVDQGISVDRAHTAVAQRYETSRDAVESALKRVNKQIEVYKKEHPQP